MLYGGRCLPADVAMIRYECQKESNDESSIAPIQQDSVPAGVASRHIESARLPC